MVQMELKVVMHKKVVLDHVIQVQMLQLVQLVVSQLL